MIANANVLVVGAGPTGLLLAAELCRRGVACRVIDANPEPLHWDRATVVHPRSLEIFESLGIVEPLLAAGVKQRMARLHSAGSILGEIDLSICGSRYGFNIGVSEEVTESILSEYLERLGGDIQRSSRLVNLKERRENIIATIDHAGVTEQVAAEWVVGCDGVRSVTRQLAGIELLGHDRPDPWAVFDATIVDWPHSYEGNYAYLDEPPVILTALPQQRWRVYLRPTAEASELVADAMATLRGYVPAIAFDNVANPMRFHCHNKVAERYRSGRILIAGDAAHVCSPSQGHGMNSGLQDAFNLAWKLALVCQGRAAPTLLDSYETERRPVAELITASGYAFEQAQDVTDPAQKRARDQELRALFSNPATRHHESIAEAELNVNYSESSIVFGDQCPTLAPGHRLPNTIEVRLAGGEAGLLHQAAHRTGHTAILCCDSSADRARIAALERALQHVDELSLVETTVVLIRSPHAPPHGGWLTDAAAAQLGVGDITLLVIRPDGHVGMRADHAHLEQLADYKMLLANGKA